MLEVPRINLYSCFHSFDHAYIKLSSSPHDDTSQIASHPPLTQTSNYIEYSTRQTLVLLFLLRTVFNPLYIDNETLLQRRHSFFPTDTGEYASFSLSY